MRAARGIAWLRLRHRMCLQPNPASDCGPARLHRAGDRSSGRIFGLRFCASRKVARSPAGERNACPVWAKANTRPMAIQEPEPHLRLLSRGDRRKQRRNSRGEGASADPNARTLVVGDHVQAEPSQANQLAWRAENAQFAHTKIGEDLRTESMSAPLMAWVRRRR